MWIKDAVDLYVRDVQQVADGFDSWNWVEEPFWTYIGTWGQDVAMSTDGSEGRTTWNLVLS